MIALGLAFLLFWSVQAGHGQSAGAPTKSAPQAPATSGTRWRTDDLREFGEFDEALEVAEGLLETERQDGGEMAAQVAKALSGIAELKERRRSRCSGDITTHLSVVPNR